MISRYYGSTHAWHIDCIVKCKDSIGKEKIYGDVDETHYGYKI